MVSQIQSYLKYKEKNMSFSSSCLGQLNTNREYQLTVNKWDKYVGEW